LTWNTIRHVAGRPAFIERNGAMSDPVTAEQLRTATEAYQRAVGDAGDGLTPLETADYRYHELLRLAGRAGLSTPPSHEDHNYFDWLRLMRRWFIKEEARLENVTPSTAKVGDDASAYIPANRCRNNRIITHKQLKALLDKLSDDARGIRRKHNGQHLFIHAGDWHRWNAEQDRQDAEALDRSAPEVEKAIAEALQLLSGDVPPRTVYAHLGWRQFGERWCYLHAGGAIGGDGPVTDVEVSPPEALAGFVLPALPQGEDLVRAVRASLAMLALGPDRVSFALLAAVYRAVLAACDFALHLCGPTGAGKTERAALAQQHFGLGLDARHLPGSWSSTGNSLEALAFTAKDTLLAVDDFAPGGSTADVARIHREADRLLRAQGNRSGRSRCRTDGTVRPARPPRGLVLSTGEDIPRGQSLRSRLLVLETTKGEMDFEALTRCQQDAGEGLYAQALAGFLRWLAPCYAEVRDRLAAERADLRDEVRAAVPAGTHLRTPGIIADLLLGLRYFLDFAREVGALGRVGRDVHWRRGRKALLEAAGTQAEQVEDAEPAGHFLRLLDSALASGRAYVAGKTGDEPVRPVSPGAWGWRLVEVGTGEHMRTEWRPSGDCVGWVDEDHLYLQPGAAYAVAQDLARDQGEALTVTAQTLWKRLHERDLLAEVDDRGGRVRYTVRRVLGRKERKVLSLPADCFCREDELATSPGH
jgi:hypothetical protein